ncbi:MAG: hypothetical protein ACI9WU_000624 [Myxococcota bacterium]|jgi:hypothetical protein
MPDIDEKRAKRAAKRARREERQRLSERPCYTKKEPFRLEGTILEERFSESRLARWRGPLQSLARRVPRHGPSRGARRRANELRIASVVVGAAVALLAPTPPVAMTGLLVIILASVLPLSPTRAARLESRASTFGRGRRTTEVTAVGIVFDGRGVTVLSGGKTRRRARMAEGEYAQEVVRSGDSLALGIAPSGSRPVGQLWFITAPEAEFPGPLDMPVSVSEAALRGLHEAMRANHEEPLA